MASSSLSLFWLHLQFICSAWLPRAAAAPLINLRAAVRETKQKFGGYRKKWTSDNNSGGRNFLDSTEALKILRVIGQP